MLEMDNPLISNSNIETIESHSEIIAKYIVDKLVSFAVFEQNRSRVNRSLSLHCYDVFTKKIVQDIVAFEHMAFDKDEFSFKNPSYNDTSYFFDQVYAGSNNWNAIEEPVSITFI